MKNMKLIGAALTATLLAACSSIETPAATQPALQPSAFSSGAGVEATSKAGEAATTSSVSSQAVKFVGALPMQSVATQALLPVGTKQTDGAFYYDDQAGVFLIPAFNYFGTQRYAMAISINGAISFDSADVAFTNQQLNYVPAAFLPSTLVAPFWDDLEVCAEADTPGQGVYVNYLTNPTRTVITWRAQRFADPCDGNTDRTATIQLVLDSGPAAQSPITFNYANAAALGYGFSGTIGFKNNAQFSQWSFNDPIAIASSYTLRSFPTQAATPPGFPSF